MSTAKEKRIYLLGRRLPRTAYGLDLVAPLTVSDINQAIEEAEEATDWVTMDSPSADALLSQSLRFLADRPHHALGNLLLQEPPSLASLAVAQQAFTAVAWTDRRKGWLPLRELLAVLESPDRANLLIGGMVDRKTHTLTVYRGDSRKVTVPLSVFKPTAAGERPVFEDFQVIDHGHAVRFGSYEAAKDAILYEGDPEFRRRLNARRRAEEQTFGASLRRLRLQRRLRQSDFAGIAARTIIRLENGETKPQAHTLAVLAKRLGVRPEAIGTY
jgi:hypothetical protein